MEIVQNFAHCHLGFTVVWHAPMKILSCRDQHADQTSTFIILDTEYPIALPGLVLGVRDHKTPFVVGLCVKTYPNF